MSTGFFAYAFRGIAEARFLRIRLNSWYLKMDSFKELRAVCSGSATQRIFNQPLNGRLPLGLMLRLAGVAFV